VAAAVLVLAGSPTPSLAGDLTDSEVTLSGGPFPADTIFVFRVYYTGSDETDAAAAVVVKIDGDQYPMTLEPGGTRVAGWWRSPPVLLPEGEPRAIFHEVSELGKRTTLPGPNLKVVPVPTSTPSSLGPPAPPPATPPPSGGGAAGGSGSGGGPAPGPEAPWEGDVRGESDVGGEQAPRPSAEQAPTEPDRPPNIGANESIEPVGRSLATPSATRDEQPAPIPSPEEGIGAPGEGPTGRAFDFLPMVAVLVVLGILALIATSSVRHVRRR